QTTAIAEPRPVDRTTRTRADAFADCLLQQRTPLCKAPLEHIGIAQAPDDLWQQVPVARGARQGQALIAHPDGVLQVTLGEVQLAEEAVDNDWCSADAFQRGEAERLLRVPPALRQGPKPAHGPPHAPL